MIHVPPTVLYEGILVSIFHGPENDCVNLGAFSAHVTREQHCLCLSNKPINYGLFSMLGPRRYTITRCSSYG